MTTVRCILFELNIYVIIKHNYDEILFPLAVNNRFDGFNEM